MTTEIYVDLSPNLTLKNIVEYWRENQIRLSHNIYIHIAKIIHGPYNVTFKPHFPAKLTVYGTVTKNTAEPEKPKK